MKKYEKEWDQAFFPMSKDLEGNFGVKILTGISHIPALFAEDWLKTIHFSELASNEDRIGSNIIKWNKKAIEITGHFVVQTAEKHLVLDYNNQQNNYIWKRLKDYLRMINKDKFIGKIYMKVWGKYIFMGYFYLLRKEIDCYHELCPEFDNCLDEKAPGMSVIKTL